MKYVKYLLFFFVILFSYPLYITFLNPISPKSTINYSFDKNNKSISLQVDYSRPYKKGRLIFGTEEENALVPYNKYWRTGANFCTDFYNSSEILFNGNKLDSGKYFLYTFPNENSWDIILNSEYGRFGFFNPNRENDILITSVTPILIDDDIEQFSIDFEEKNESILLRLRWAKTSVSIPIN
tara:strand:+ start:566 stop:1111 length:546 start_codon:yes stop_codon:yes gene_type:complete